MSALQPPYFGCGNNPCFLDNRKPGGMQTQGSCRCFNDIHHSQRHRVRQGVMTLHLMLRAAQLQLAQETARLDWMLSEGDANPGDFAQLRREIDRCIVEDADARP